MRLNLFSDRNHVFRAVGRSCWVGVGVTLLTQPYCTDRTLAVYRVVGLRVLRSLGCD